MSANTRPPQAKQPLSNHSERNDSAVRLRAKLHHILLLFLDKITRSFDFAGDLRGILAGSVDNPDMMTSSRSEKVTSLCRGCNHLQNTL